MCSVCVCERAHMCMRKCACGCAGCGVCLCIGGVLTLFCVSFLFIVVLFRFC